MVAVAVKVAVPPAQIEVLVEVILTLGLTVGVTVTVMPVEVAVSGLAQLAFEVNTQVTTSLFAKVLEVKVAALLPAFAPLTFH